MFRRLIDDFRDFPATMTLCSLWIVVFVLMVLNEMTHGYVPTLGKLVLVVPGGHPFGDMTLGDFFGGELWRPLTATFVHYGLLHLGMNLFVMYQLGGLVESWYGPWQFTAVYVVIGYGGNLLSALVRQALGSDPRVPSGGGSTVILGLAALCALLGWRSRTRIGDYLRSQMVWLLIATAVLGQIVPIIDNWGHAGGALLGAAIGFAHRTLIRMPQRPAAKWAGALGVILLIVSAGAQYRIESALARLQATERVPLMLQETSSFYLLAVQRARYEHLALVPEAFRHAPRETIPQTAGSRPLIVKPLSLLDSPDAAFRNELKWHLDHFDTLRADLGTGPTAGDFDRVRGLLAQVFTRPPSDRIVREFMARLNTLGRRARTNIDTARARYESMRRYHLG